MNSKNFERTNPDRLYSFATGVLTAETNERDRPSAARPLARERNSILSHGSEIGRQPVTDVNQPLHHSLTELRSAQVYLTAWILGFWLTADAGSASALLFEFRITWELIHS